MLFKNDNGSLDRGLHHAPEMAGGAPPPDWTPEMRAAMEQVLPKDVASLIKSLIPMIGSQAWVFMGKVENPLLRKVIRDLDQARLAVDCVGALMEKVDRFFTDEERTVMRQMEAELKLNFVGCLKEDATKKDATRKEAAQKEATQK